MIRTAIVLLALVSLEACTKGSDDSLFPDDYRSTYTEVRNCRSSSDHDLHRIRVLAAPDALTPYMDRQTPFPVGAIVLKEEFDFADIDCSGDIVEWTAMEKTSSSDHLGWTWQSIIEDSVKTNAGRCINCHTDCGVPPDGYDGTCTVP